MASAITIVVAIVLGLGLLFWFVDTTKPGADQRASMLGESVGFLCMIPFGVIWFMWAMQVRKERKQKNRPRFPKR
ncbi:MAG: hypothetical protein DWI24_07945 [Planctomycetota bacterium]|nr:MAG: hypothetical protein DWI24_07945 [Planctomycetota bacterium]